MSDCQIIVKLAAKLFETEHCISLAIAALFILSSDLSRTHKNSDYFHCRGAQFRGYSYVFLFIQF